MSILVTGGAGYIGSHVVKQLLEKKEDIIVIDNLSTGKIEAINSLKEIYSFKFINVDLKNFEKIEEIFKNNKIETIIHFAAYSIVGESMSNPSKYYMNNTVNTANLINLAALFNVEKFIFSSTAACYGEPDFSQIKGSRIIDENFDTKPINPYGSSKLMSENIIKDVVSVNSNM